MNKAYLGTERCWYRIPCMNHIVDNGMVEGCYKFPCTVWSANVVCIATHAGDVICESKGDIKHAAAEAVPDHRPKSGAQREGGRVPAFHRERGAQGRRRGSPRLPCRRAVVQFPSAQAQQVGLPLICKKLINKGRISIENAVLEMPAPEKKHCHSHFQCDE